MILVLPMAADLFYVTRAPGWAPRCLEIGRHIAHLKVLEGRVGDVWFVVHTGALTISRLSYLPRFEMWLHLPLHGEQLREPMIGSREGESHVSP